MSQHPSSFATFRNSERERQRKRKKKEKLFGTSDSMLVGVVSDVDEFISPPFSSVHCLSRNQ